MERKNVTAEELPENNGCDRGDITYVKRENKEYTVHYFVITSSDRKSANINLGGKKIDIYRRAFRLFKQFEKESCVWARGIEDKWYDNFCFLEMSI